MVEGPLLLGSRSVGEIADHEGEVCDRSTDGGIRMREFGSGVHGA